MNKQQLAKATTLAFGNASFAFALHKTIAKSEGNLFYSPFSISSALAMTYAGAKGKTEKEMEQVLQFGAAPAELHPTFAALLGELSSNEDYKLVIANRLWGEQSYPFRATFLDLTREYYDGGFVPVDFKTESKAARGKINTWVEEKTNKKITDLIPAGLLDSLTRLVLTNAIHFKGSWADQFDEHATRPMSFELSPKKQIKTSMMFKTAQFRYAQKDGVQLLELPYKGGRLSMVLLMPVERHQLAQVEAKLEPKMMSQWNGALTRQEVEIQIPKLKITAKLSLKKVLQEMGMKTAFSPNEADFTGMSNLPKDSAEELYIAEVLHKAFVEVNEEGTEAAAATAVVMKARGVAKPRHVRFIADQPFLFLIRDRKTSSVLFVGRVVDPTGSVSVVE
ncbi:MAG: serpin family protein [Deltaproteobacteria bacterium]|nr:serpin family protein [Deltaproteobacteria bacterium]